MGKNTNLNPNQLDTLAEAIAAIAQLADGHVRLVNVARMSITELRKNGIMTVIDVDSVEGMAALSANSTDNITYYPNPDNPEGKLQNIIIYIPGWADDQVLTLAKLIKSLIFKPIPILTEIDNPLQSDDESAAFIAKIGTRCGKLVIYSSLNTRDAIQWMLGESM